MELQWNQGEPFLIQVNPQLVDLTPMGEQAPDPQGVVVEVGPRMAVGRNVHVVQLHLAIADQAEAIPQVGLSCPD